MTTQSSTPGFSQLKEIIIQTAKEKQRMIRIKWRLFFYAYLVVAVMLLIPQMAQAAPVNPSYKMGAVQPDPGGPSAIDDRVEINEDQASVINVMNNDSASQGNSITISAVDTPSQGSAVIEGNAIRYTPSSDFAGVDSFRYTIRNASGKTATATVYVTVLGVNDPPINIMLSNDQVIAEQDYWNLWNISIKLPTAHLPSGTTIGAFSTTDPDRDDTHSYSLIQTTNVPFTIVGNELRTSSRISLSYQNSRQFTLAVRSRDRMGATFDRSFIITVLSTFFPSGPVALSLSSEQIAENQPVSTTVGNLNTADAQSAVHTYQLVPGAGSDDNQSFLINNNSLQTTAVLDYEAKGSYSVRVRSTNGSGALIEQNFTINVVDDNNEPNEPAPQNCAGNPIKLLDTPDATVEISAIKVAKVSTTGCTLTGKMRIKIRGSEATGIDFSGRVDEKNQLQSNASLQAAIQAAGQQVVSADLQGMQISGFTLTIAGLTLKVEAAEIEYYLGRPSLRLTKNQWCMPEEWGGLCTPSSASTSLIDGSGFKPGVNASFSLPNIKLGKKGGANVPTLTGLSAEIKPVDNGYAISAGGEFGFPKLPKGANGCTLTAALTIYADPATGAIMMEVSAAAQPQTLTAANGATLRQVSIGVSCKQGIPIDTTGLQLTGIKGTLALRPGEQSIELDVTIETEGKLGSFSFATINGNAKLLWDPQWGFDLGVTVKLLNYFEASNVAAKIRPNRFQFTGHVKSVLTDFDMVFNAWTDSGSHFHMNGTGQLTLGISKGKLFSGSKDKCHDVTTTVCNVVDKIASFFGIGGAKKVCSNATKQICEKTDIAIPPWDLTVSKLKGEFGDFTNGKWGIKATIQRGQVIGKIAQELLNFFGVPSEFGVYIDQSGNVAVGGVQDYKLLTPPAIQAALERWQAAQAAQATGAGMSVAEDSQLNIVSENELQVAVPLRLNPENTIRAASVISQVRVTAPTTVTFILATNITPTLNLIAPDGTTITAANYNQSPVNQRYRINYGQRTVYEVFQQSDMPDRQSARLRFIPIAHHPALTAVDVLVDGVPVWHNVKPYNPSAPDPDYGGDYIAIEPGPHTIALVPTGQITAVIALLSLETRPGIGYTLFTDLGPFGVNNPDTPQLSVVTDAGATPPSFGQPYVRFIHVGRKNRFLDVWINGKPTFTELGHNDASPYKLLPAGDVNIAVKDEDTGATVIPTHLLQLGQSSSVVTFFLFDQDSNEAPLGYAGALDDLYLPRIYTIYQVGGADMGDWKVDMQGQLDDPGLALSVVSFANPTQLSNVTVDASKLSQTKVNWTVKTEFAPTTISLYANPAELTSPLIITDANGIATTEQVTNYMGFLVTQMTVTDPAQLNNAIGQLTTDLSRLESGTYRLWLQVNDGVNPPRSVYAVKPGTQEIAVITVDNAANFPTAWTPTITTTVNVERALLALQWTGLIHPDIDSYTLHIGSTSGSSERTDSDLVAYYDRDAAGNPVGGPLVIGNFSNIQPGQNYFLYIEAVDTDTGRAVRSPDFSVSIPAGDYALTTPTSKYVVSTGQTITVPVSLNVLSALFQPDVALAIADEGLPRGIRIQFQDDTLGQTVLRSTEAHLSVTAAGTTNAVQVVQNEESFNAPPDQQTANLVITVGANVQPGNYVLTIAGYNSASGIRTSQVTLQVLDASTSSNFVYLPVIQR